MFQFYSVLERSRQAMASLEYSALTIFAPTNKAFQYKSSNFDDLALYHLCNVPQNLNQLGGSISTELGGSPPLWVTRRNYNNRQDIYVNNAKVIAHRSNYQQANANGKKQVSFEFQAAGSIKLGCLCNLSVGLHLAERS